ncbi:hypothetical protein KR018_011384, partial [Drosophila ironensis]
MDRGKYSAEYFEKALAEAYGCQELSVEDFHIEVVKQSGENFCSVIYRVALEFRKTPTSVVESGKYVLKDLLPAWAALGTNEKEMYELMLPKMSRILALTPPELGDNKLSAECLFAETSGGKEIYILEDLGALGYTSLDRFHGLELEDAKVCLRKMAQFHGSSMILNQNEPELVAQLSPSHYAKGVSDPFAQVIVLNGTEFVADIFAGELPEISKKMLAQIPEAYSQRMQSVVDPKKSKFNVIVHGDLWVDNMMYDKINKKVILLDFQNCFWASPAIDLHFFFYTCLQMEVLIHQQNVLLNYYFQNLQETLTHCGFKGPLPTFDDLKEEMKRCLFYAYYSACCELPICSASPEASADFNVSTFEDTEAMLLKRRQLFDSERVRKTVKASLM